MPWWYQLMFGLFLVPLLALGVSNFLRISRERLIVWSFYFVGHSDAARPVSSFYWSFGQDRAERFLTYRAVGSLLILAGFVLTMVEQNPSLWLTLAGYVALGQLVILSEGNRLRALDVARGCGLVFRQNKPLGMVSDESE